MSVVLILDSMREFITTQEVKNWKFFDEIIGRYEILRKRAAEIEAAGSQVEVLFFDESFVAVCSPPEGVETEEEFSEHLKKHQINVKGFGFFEDGGDDLTEEEIDNMCGGQVFAGDYDCCGQDCGSCEIEDVPPLIDEDDAKSLHGEKITYVELVDGYGLEIHFESGRVLSYDEDDEYGVFKVK